MARALGTTILNAMFAQTTTEAAYALLAISHSTFSTIRFVNNSENVTSNGDTYIAAPFAVQLPPDSEEQRPVIRIVASNIDRALVDEVRTLSGSRERMKATLTIVLSGDPDTAVATYEDFEIVNVSYTAQVITFDLTLEGLLTEAFPYYSQTPNTVPGIFD